MIEEEKRLEELEGIIKGIIGLEQERIEFLKYKLQKYSANPRTKRTDLEVARAELNTANQCFERVKLNLFVLYSLFPELKRQEDISGQMYFEFYKR